MGSILMVVADVLGLEPFQVSLVQDNYVIEQVSSATTEPNVPRPRSARDYQRQSSPARSPSLS